jgi:hypothetical protein
MFYVHVGSCARDLQVGADVFAEAVKADPTVHMQFLASADARDYLQALAEVFWR